MSAAAPLAVPFEVRDYECDLQGIVNNAIYLHYFEHARHQFLKHAGVDFAALTAQGIHLVVVKAEVEYKSPLRSGDTFVVESHLERLGAVRFVFLQDIYRTTARSRALNAAARFTCAAMNADGKPILPKVLAPLFGESI